MAPTYNKKREDLSRAIITHQVFSVAEHMYKKNVLFDEDDANWVIFPEYILPRSWGEEGDDVLEGSSGPAVPLKISFPMEYPELPPVGFYLKVELKESQSPSHLYPKAYHEADPAPIEEGWEWYCVYIERGYWRPSRIKQLEDWQKGDNLWTYMKLIAEVLEDPQPSQD